MADKLADTDSDLKENVIAAEVQKATADSADIEGERKPTDGDAMEKLKIDDRDDLNVSVEEDLLEARSLFMSDSEDDENGADECKNDKGNVGTIAAPELVHSEEDTAVMMRWEEEEEEEEEDLAVTKPITDLQNRQSDDDELVKSSKPSGSLSDAESEEEKGTNRKDGHVKKTIRKSLRIDSSSEDEEDHHSQKEKPNKKKIPALIDSDSEPENVVDRTEEETETTREEKKSKKGKVSALIDSESESDSGSSLAAGNDNDDDSVPGHRMDGSQDESEPSKPKTKTMRASAKKALDEMQAIQSEQQRLHREAHISVPYHKPKRYTLQEFLKRRTIVKPKQETGTSPAPKSLKMSPEELEEYAKRLEERAKEAQEFFKSESESEEEVFKDNAGVIDIVDKQEGDAERAETEVDRGGGDRCEAPSAAPLFSEDSAIASGDSESQAHAPKNCLPCEDVPEVLSSQPIVTEVFELPKLNIGDLNLGSGTDIAGHLAENAQRLNSEARANDFSTSEAESSSSRKSSTADDVKRLIREKSSQASPCLRGDPHMLIDLETGDLVTPTPSGADNLLRRLMATNKVRKPPPAQTLNILSTEKGKIEMSTVTVANTEDNDIGHKEPKPGAAYFKLKHDLKSLIRKKRLEDMQKKLEDEEEQQREEQKCLDDDEEEEEEDEEYESQSKLDVMDIDDEENAIRDDDVPVDDEDDDEDLEIHEAENVENEVDDDMNDSVKAAKDEDDAQDDDDDDDDDEDDDLDDLEDAASQSIHKNRIIKPFASDSDDEIDYLRTQTQSSFAITAKSPAPSGPVPASVSLAAASSLFDIEPAGAEGIDPERELMALCSGGFETQPTQRQVASPMPDITQSEAKSDGAEAKGVTDSQTAGNKQSPRRRQILTSSEEEEAGSGRGSASTRIKKLTKRLKKRKAKLGFSDDEEESELEKIASETEGDNCDGNNDDNDEPQTFIDYDSEENEIVVQMTKQETLKRAEKFFEKEAELSESEWGSADEDERNLDRYDGELGDEDEFDREKLQRELGQIHARKVLDEDIREVRRLQEIFFEDEETDGVGRQRQFRWKNAESGFNLDDAGNRIENDGGGNGGDSADEENEHMWRKMRFEREQMLEEQQAPNGTSPAGPTSKTDSPLAREIIKKINVISIRKLTAMTATDTTTTKTMAAGSPCQPSGPLGRQSSPFLIANKGPASSLMGHQKPTRGSFLERDRETLTKLANITKAGGDIDDSSGAVSVKTANAKNFVFQTLTEEERETLKRKAVDLMNSSSEQGVNYMKKPKTEPKRDKCLIDQLL